MDVVNKDFEQLKTHYESARVILHSAELFDVPTVKGSMGGWSPAQHLYHLALTNKSIARLIQSLLERRFGDETSQVNTERIKDLEKGFFPRGGTSPANLVPPVDITREGLEAALHESLTTMNALETLNFGPSNTFDHVYYGPLDAAQWLRFAQLHMAHHLELIGEQA